MGNQKMSKLTEARLKRDFQQKSEQQNFTSW